MLGVSNSRPIQTHNRQITHRLFCFTYAGGAASIYRDWHNQLPQNIEVHAVQFPGHGNRLSESLFKKVQPLVESIRHELLSYLEDHLRSLAILWEPSLALSWLSYFAGRINLVHHICFYPPDFTN